MDGVRTLKRENREKHRRIKIDMAGEDERWPSRGTNETHERRESYKRAGSWAKGSRAGRKLEMWENGMLGSNQVFLTTSLLVKLSLGVSSNWESAAQATGLRGGKWSSAAFFSVRCLVTMSCRNTGRTFKVTLLGTKSASPPAQL